MKNFHSSIFVGPAQQRGFSIVTAIFLIVVLAGLGAAMVSISTSSNTASVQDLQGARAYQAARAGAEWALYRNLRQGTACPFNSSFTMPAGALQGFTVTVSCAVNSMPGVAAPAATTSISTVLRAGDTTADIVAPKTSADLVDGMRVVGAGLPGDTVISARIAADKIVLSRAPATSGTVTLTYHSPLDRWSITAVACNQPTGAGACPNPSNNGDYIQRTLFVQF